MEITTKRLRRCELVTAKGRIDSATVKELAQVLDSLKQAGRYKIVFNMKDVSYISSAGLSELIATQNDCKKIGRGELVLAEVPLRVQEALDLVGLKPLFKVYESETEAVGSF